MGSWNTVLVGGLLAIGLSGCGKFKAPEVPEAVTPSVVASLQASVTKGAVVLTWMAPSTDRRDKRLKSLDGYRVERRKVMSADDIDPSTFAVVGPRSGFSLVGELQDTSLANLEQLKEKARAEHAPVRRVKADAALTNFRFEDTDVKLGDQLLYRIIPINEYGQGRVSRLARVIFRGLGSEITYPEPEAVDEDLGFNPFR